MSSSIIQLDNTIRTLELLLLDARSLRNANAPLIHRLPLEIISFIFDLVSIEERPYPPVHTGKREANKNMHSGMLFERLTDQNVWKEAFMNGSLGWIRLTHVCRLWREILLDMTSL